MSGYSFLLAIIRRDYGEDYIDFLKAHGAANVFGVLGEGAAQEKTLDLLGLERKEKVLLSCVVSCGDTRRLLRGLRDEMHIDAPNTGIALSVRVNGIGGVSALHCLCGESSTKNDEVKTLKDAPYSLIIAIAERGHTSLVMDAAREAGATGGTIVRAKGTASDMPARFFGVSIAEEKDMVYIAARHADRDAILRAIMQKAGAHSPAHAVVFSLPVEAAAGLREPTEE